MNAWIEALNANPLGWLCLGAIVLGVCGFIWAIRREGRR